MTIPGIPEQASREVLEVLQTVDGLRRVVLFGSRAKGTFRLGSDIDLCLEADSLDFSELVNLENKLDDLMLPWRFDVAVRDQITNSELLEHIDRVGVSILPC